MEGSFVTKLLAKRQRLFDGLVAWFPDTRLELHNCWHMDCLISLKEWEDLPLCGSYCPSLLGLWIGFPWQEFGRSLPWDDLEIACPNVLILQHFILDYSILGTWDFWLTDLWRVGLIELFMVARHNMILEAILFWLTDSWGDWLRLTVAQSNLPLTGLLSPDQAPQLTTYYWDSLDAKCWLVVKIIHYKMVILMQCLLKILKSKFININLVRYSERINDRNIMLI